jgi:hypothetical protein
MRERKIHSFSPSASASARIAATDEVAIGPEPMLAERWSAASRSV